MRYEMELIGEPTDKMSVRVKSRNPSDHDVVEAIREFEEILTKKPEGERHLSATRDQVFHELMGDDAHSYCRTYGSGVPRRLVYSQDPSVPRDSSDFIKKITEEVTQKVTEEVTKKVTEDVTKKVTEGVTDKVTEGVTEKLTVSFQKKMDDEFKNIYDMIHSMDTTEVRSTHRQVPDATSGHLRESIGEGMHLSPQEQAATVGERAHGV